MNPASCVILAVIAVLFVLAVWRWHRKGGCGCEKGGSCGCCGGCCHCHDKEQK